MMMGANKFHNSNHFTGRFIFRQSTAPCNSYFELKYTKGKSFGVFSEAKLLINTPKSHTIKSTQEMPVNSVLIKFFKLNLDRLSSHQFRSIHQLQ